MIMAVFKPASPPVISTPEAYLEGIIRTKSEVVFCVPSVIEVSSSMYMPLTIWLADAYHAAYFCCLSDLVPRPFNFRLYEDCALHCMNLLITFRCQPLPLARDIQTFGGAPMTKSVGDTLTARGLKLIPFFGLCVPFNHPNFHHS